MKKLLLVGFVVLSLATLATNAQAFGWRNRGCCAPEPCCEVAPISYCGSHVAVAAAPVPSPCVVSPCYVQQTVTCYKAVTKTRVVHHKVRKMVTKEVDEPYTYYELVPVVTPQKRTETVHKMVTKEVPYKYTVMQQVMEPVKKTVTTYKVVSKQVPYKYTVMQQVVEPVKRTVTTHKVVHKQVPYTYTVMQQVVEPVKRVVTTYQCVPKTVVEHVSSCHMVASVCCDPCTGCCISVCRPVMTTCAVQRVIMESVPVQHEVTEHVCRLVPVQKEGVRTVCETVPVTQEVTVNVCKLVPVEKEGVRTVQETVPVTQEVTVNVCKLVPVEKTGTRLVCETIPETREYTVNVTTYNRVEKQGVRKRLVCEWVEEVVPVTQTYCEMVPYTHVINVPVCQPAPVCCDPCYTPARGGCGSRGMLFGRLFGGGCCGY